MALKLGDKSITNIYVGDKSIVNIYMGEKLIYSKDSGGGEVSLTPYLQAGSVTGRPRIDTKYSPTINTRVEIGFLPDMTALGSRYLFGYQSSSTSSYRMTVMMSVNGSSMNYSWAYCNSKTNTAQAVPVELDKINVITLGKGEFTVNGIAYTGTMGSNMLIKYPIYLFNCNQSSSTPSTSSSFIGKIYYCKIYESGTLKMDLIAHKDADEKPCMMDKLTGTCYYESGTTDVITYGEESIENALGTFVTCDECGATYKESEGHPYHICSLCGEEYVNIEEHTHICEYCGGNHHKSECSISDAEYTIAKTLYDNGMTSKTTFKGSLMYNETDRYGYQLTNSSFTDTHATKLKSALSKYGFTNVIYTTGSLQFIDSSHQSGCTAQNLCPVHLDYVDIQTAHDYIRSNK